MATSYYYAAHFNTPLHQSPVALASHHPFGISSRAMDLPVTPVKTEKKSHVMSATERRILFANGKMDEQGDSLFFRLPAELRNQVYEELLCPEAPSLKDLARRTKSSSTVPTLYPAILSTCRKIHEEAADLLYTTPVFHAHPSLLASLPHLSSAARPVLYPSVISKIKRWQLNLRLDTDPRFTMAQATAAFSGAEYLQIRVWQSMFDGADCSVLRLFLGVRGVKVAKVGGSAKPELARWLEKRMMEPKEKAAEEVCQCEERRREVRCVQCCKTVNIGTEWFSGRDNWTFGNR